MLRLASGSPLNAANSSDINQGINFDVDLVRWSRSTLGSVRSSHHDSSSH